MSQDNSHYVGIKLVLTEVNQKSRFYVDACVTSYETAQHLQFAGNDQ